MLNNPDVDVSTKVLINMRFISRQILKKNYIVKKKDY